MVGENEISKLILVPSIYFCLEKMTNMEVWTRMIQNIRTIQNIQNYLYIRNIFKTVHFIQNFNS